ncbi:head-tail connector protein [Bacillus multifaciens]|uniref:head-tail connector protein n=1 Tax=Bacillus multifaciens TaxID=3068506 RepID=UPI0027425AF3|nr:head-tail connector protein [Bacillus sp. WLY-B-L8]MDP7981032.1 head-tail connector protein [Bacillus sp. WLY-B-L8]
MVTTVDRVKKILRIDGNEQDDLIDIFIPIVDSFIRRYTGNDFEHGYPPDYEIIAVRLVGYHLFATDEDKQDGVKNERLGSYNVSYATDEEQYPKHLLKGLRKRLRTLCDSEEE